MLRHGAGRPEADREEGERARMHRRLRHAGRRRHQEGDGQRQRRKQRDDAALGEEPANGASRKGTGDARAAGPAEMGRDPVACEGQPVEIDARADAEPVQQVDDVFAGDVAGRPLA